MRKSPKTIESMLNEPGLEKKQAIIAALSAIPHGHITSYGAIARRAGLPGHARLVCRVLRELPEGIAIPWWRVVRSDGRPGLDPDGASGREQRHRLQAEGLSCTGVRLTGPWW